MNWKQRLFSNMFLRNMLADLGNRSGFVKKSTVLVPYFQYKLGEYQTDYYLYFPSEPYTVRYKNEIFNKLSEYSGYDITKFLDFHYVLYSDKIDFLKFLNYEITERLKSGLSKSWRLKLNTAVTWMEEKRNEIQKLRELELRETIERDVHSIMQAQSNHTIPDVSLFAKDLSEKLSEHFERLISETEKSLKDLTSSFSTGNIQLNNHNHEDKIIQLLILIQQIQAPPQQARVEQLFKKFTASDIASILNLHFEAFQDNKLNTIQRKVGDQLERIKPGNPRVKKLSESLQEYFYL